MPTVSVRYIVDDVDAAIGFYTGHLGFTEVMHPAPPFAMLDAAICGSCSARRTAGRAAARWGGGGVCVCVCVCVLCGGCVCGGGGGGGPGGRCRSPAE